MHFVRLPSQISLEMGMAREKTHLCLESFFLFFFLGCSRQPHWPPEIQTQPAGPAWPSRPPSAAWGVDTAPGKRLGRSAPWADCVRPSHLLLLWAEWPSAGRRPAPNKGKGHFKGGTQLRLWPKLLTDRRTSVQRMIFPFSLYSDFWNIFVLLMDSMDFPSMGLIILCGTETKQTLQTKD